MGFHAGWMRVAFPRLLDDVVAAFVAGRRGGGARDDDDAAADHHQLAVAGIVCRALSRPPTKHLDAPPSTSYSAYVPPVVHFWRSVIQPTMMLDGDMCVAHFSRRVIQPAMLLDGDTCVAHFSRRVIQLAMLLDGDTCVAHFSRRVIQPAMLLDGDTCVVHFRSRVIEPATELSGGIGQVDRSYTTTVSSIFGMASPLPNGTMGRRWYSGSTDEEWRFIRERRYWDPAWVRILDSNLRGMGLTPFGPLSRLFLSMVAYGTMLQSLKEVISSITWFGENTKVLGDLLLRLLIRALDQMPKSPDGAHASFYEYMILDGSGCPFF